LPCAHLLNKKLQTKNARYSLIKKLASGTGKKYLPPTTTTNGVNDLSHRNAISSSTGNRL
jgi:hypothetical protein